MPIAKSSVTYSLTTSLYYPPGSPAASSSSGPPPSHSDSPSPQGPRPPGGTIPAHWRKVTYTVVAEDLEASRSGGRARVPHEVKRQAIEQWLTQALAPHLEFKGRSRHSGCEGLDKVLEATVKRITSDRKLVDRIWDLKKHQA